MSSVTWPFESQVVICYRYSIFTKSVSPRYLALSILGSRSWPFRVTRRHHSRDHSNPNGSFPVGGPLDPSLYLHPFSRYLAKVYLGTTLTFQGQVTSSVTWPFDSQVVISYRCSIGTKSVSPTIVEIMGPNYIGVMTLSSLIATLVVCLIAQLHERLWSSPWTSGLETYHSIIQLAGHGPLDESDRVRHLTCSDQISSLSKSSSVCYSVSVLTLILKHPVPLLLLLLLYTLLNLCATIDTIDHNILINHLSSWLEFVALS